MLAECQQSNVIIVDVCFPLKSVYMHLVWSISDWLKYVTSAFELDKRYFIYCPVVPYVVEMFLVTSKPSSFMTVPHMLPKVKLCDALSCTSHCNLLYSKTNLLSQTILISWVAITVIYFYCNALLKNGLDSSGADVFSVSELNEQWATGDLCQHLSWCSYVSSTVQPLASAI